MLNKIKEIIRPIIPQGYLNKIRKRNEEIQYKDWFESGKPIPPPHIVKQKIISQIQQEYKYTILIETGTYLGDMVEAQKKNFKRIISIELATYYFKKSTQRFKKDLHVEIVLGDSGKILNEILVSIQEPAIFWLDGHYSQGLTAKGDLNCPIFEELQAIFKFQSHYNPIILIDDARLFIGEHDYPTIEELKEYILLKNSNYILSVKDDVIRFSVN